MIIVNLIGGLGNQMFQYALGRCLSYRTKMDLVLNVQTYKEDGSDRNYELDIFKLGSHIVGDTESIKMLVDNSSLPTFRVNERVFQYDDKLIVAIDNQMVDLNGRHLANLKLSGYWQSYRYFQNINAIVKQDFTFVNELEGKWKLMADKIKNCESVMINVRRTDYLQKLDYHGVVSLEYIKNGIEIFEKKVKHPIFFVFSDDMQWCTENFSKFNNLIFVGEEYHDARFQYYLQLMSLCKHFLIANSTFAWWSAWLSKNSRKIVVAPKNWFAQRNVDTSDLLFQNWIKI